MTRRSNLDLSMIHSSIQYSMYLSLDIPAGKSRRFSIMPSRMSEMAFSYSTPRAVPREELGSASTPRGDSPRVSIMYLMVRAARVVLPVPPFPARAMVKDTKDSFLTEIPSPWMGEGRVGVNITLPPPPPPPQRGGYDTSPPPPPSVR